MVALTWNTVRKRTWACMIVAAATVSETSSYADAPTTPAAVQLTGTITTLYQSFMPASKNAGKTVGGLEIYFNGWTLSPAQSATNLKEIVVFRDDISIVKPPSPPVSDKTGSCKVTLQTNVNSTAAVQMLEVTVTEPGSGSQPAPPSLSPSIFGQNPRSASTILEDGSWQPPDLPCPL